MTLFFVLLNFFYTEQTIAGHIVLHWIFRWCDIEQLVNVDFVFERLNRLNSVQMLALFPRLKPMPYTANEGPVRTKYKCLVPNLYSQKWNC